MLPFILAAVVTLFVVGSYLIAKGVKGAEISPPPGGTPPPLPLRFHSVEDLYAHAGLSEEEEWMVRADIARARARLFPESP